MSSDHKQSQWSFSTFFTLAVIIIGFFLWVAYENGSFSYQEILK